MPTSNTQDKPSLNNSPQKYANWFWNVKREKAAGLIADDQMTDEQIAVRVGVTRKIIGLWKRVPEFQARVTELRAVYAETVRKRGIALLERRIESYLDDYEATQIIIKERGDQLHGELLAKAEATGVKVDPYAGGARTGFIARDYKGKDADTPVYVYDSALMKDRLSIRKQLAQELGQFSEKREVSGPGGGPIQTAGSLEIRKLSDEVLEKMAEELNGGPGDVEAGTVSEALSEDEGTPPEHGEHHEQHD